MTNESAFNLDCYSRDDQSKDLSSRKNVVSFDHKLNHNRAYSNTAMNSFAATPAEQSSNKNLKSGTLMMSMSHD